jgi:hypothetical protein
MRHVLLKKLETSCSIDTVDLRSTSMTTGVTKRENTLHYVAKNTWHALERHNSRPPSSGAAKPKIVPVNDKSMKFSTQSLKQHRKTMGYSAT